MKHKSFILLAAATMLLTGCGSSNQLSPKQQEVIEKKQKEITLSELMASDETFIFYNCSEREESFRGSSSPEHVSIIGNRRYENYNTGEIGWHYFDEIIEMSDEEIISELKEKETTDNHYSFDDNYVLALYTNVDGTLVNSEDLIFFNKDDNDWYIEESFSPSTYSVYCNLYNTRFVGIFPPSEDTERDYNNSDNSTYFNTWYRIKSDSKKQYIINTDSVNVKDKHVLINPSYADIYDYFGLEQPTETEE